MWQIYRFYFAAGNIPREPKPTNIVLKAQSQAHADKKAHKIVDDRELKGVYNVQKERG